MVTPAVRAVVMLVIPVVTARLTMPMLSWAVKTSPCQPVAQTVCRVGDVARNLENAAGLVAQAKHQRDHLVFREGVVE